MSQTLKKILLYAVGYPAFFLVWLVLGAYWTFPYDRVREFVIQEAERDGSTHLEIEELSPSWLTGIEADGVRFATIPDDGGEPAVLEVTHLEARVSLLSLLMGEQSIDFDAQLEAGQIEGTYTASEEATSIQATLTNVDLRKLGPLQAAVGLPLAGRANGTVDLTIASEPENTTGSVELTVRGLSVGDGETPLMIEGLGAGLTLERMNLGTLQVRMRTERGVGTFQRLRADGEHAELWGTGSLRLVHPLRMSSMDLLVRVKFKDAYRESSDRMRALFSLLELNPQVRPARTSDGALQWRIQGAFASRIRMTPSGRTPMPGVDREAAE